MSIFFFIIIIVALVMGGQVVSQALEQSARRPEIDPAREAEIGELKERVEYLTSEIERLTEEQRFMTRLLEGSPAGSTRPSEETAGEGGSPDPKA
jgi:cell division protein FtsB